MRFARGSRPALNASVRPPREEGCASLEHRRFRCLRSGGNGGVPAATLSVETDERLVRAFVDPFRNVRVVTSSGKHIRITSRSRYHDAKLAPDGRTFGALVITKRGPGLPNDDIEVCEKLVIYRDGRIIQSLTPGGFIRAWGFWSEGTQVAIYSGALHFAGWYVLLDLESGRELATSRDPITDQSPPWVRTLEP